MTFGGRIAALGGWLLAIVASAMFFSASPVDAQQAGSGPACSLSPVSSSEGAPDYVSIRFAGDPGQQYSAYINNELWVTKAGDESFTFSTRDLGDYKFELAEAGANQPRTRCGTVELGSSVRAPYFCRVEQDRTAAYISWRDDGFLDAEYVVRRTVNGNGPYWQARVSVLAWQDLRMTAGNTYQYWVERLTPDGRSQRASCGSITFGDFEDTQPRTPVTCAVFLNNANDLATLSFVRGPYDNVARFVVRRSRDGGPFYWAGRLDVDPVTVNTSATITNGGLVAGSSYTYTIESLNAAGERSSRVVCGTVNVTAAPIPVEICTVSLANNTATVRFGRSVSDNADRFILYRSRNGGPSYWAGRFDADQLDGNVFVPTQFINGGLASNTSYTYSIKTVSAGGAVSAPTLCGTVTTAGSGGSYYS